MEKIQHSINSLSLIFAGFFVIELMALVFGFAMEPDTPLKLSELSLMLLFYAMIPSAIIMLQLAAKRHSAKWLWLGIVLFILHIVLFVLYGFATSS